MATFAENQIVELCDDVVEDGVALSRGTHGTVIDVYSNPSEGYEVEFIAENGTVLGQLTLLPNQIRSYTPRISSATEL